MGGLANKQSTDAWLHNRLSMSAISLLFQALCYILSYLWEDGFVLRKFLWILPRQIHDTKNNTVILQLHLSARHVIHLMCNWMYCVAQTRSGTMNFILIPFIDYSGCVFASETFRVGSQCGEYEMQWLKSMASTGRIRLNHQVKNMECNAISSAWIPRITSRIQCDSVWNFMAIKVQI